MSTRSSSTLPRPASGNFHSFLFFGSLSYVHPIPLVKIMYFTFSINIVQHATPVMTRTAAENVKAAGLSVWQQEQITIVDTSGGQAGYDVHQWWANTSKHHGLVLLWNDEYVLNRYSVRRNCSVHALYVTVWTRVLLRSLAPYRHRAYAHTCRSAMVLGDRLALLFFPLFSFSSLCILLFWAMMRVAIGDVKWRSVGRLCTTDYPYGYLTIQRSVNQYFNLQFFNNNWAVLSGYVILVARFTLTGPETGNFGCQMYHMMIGVSLLL